MSLFDQHGGEGLAWMSRGSANDGDVLIEITDKIREPVEIYTWLSRGSWISLSVNLLAQSVDGKYMFIKFDADKTINVEALEDRLLVNNMEFICPPTMIKSYAAVLDKYKEIIAQ
ncbi:hypothetical protein U1839_25780 [Sphingomonas sp. RT2P30]|uniref:hypothetical protein n=1 Tax=Parasphingomonas halimpatiens TaxID=3096162 RepID=UPI002FCCAA5F